MYKCFNLKCLQIRFFHRILIAIFFPQKSLFILNFNRIKLTPSKCPSQRAETRPDPGHSNRPRDRSWRWKTRCWIPEKLIPTFWLFRRNLFTTIALAIESRIEESGSQFRITLHEFETRILENTRKFDGKFDSGASKNRRKSLRLYIMIVIGTFPGNLNF